MNDVLHGFQNVCDKNALQENLTFIALYIGLYESFADTVESHVESFFCNDAFLDKNGKIRYKPSEEYVEEIKNRSVDDKGNHNTLKSTMLWFVENSATTSAAAAMRFVPPITMWRAVRKPYRRLLLHFWKAQVLKTLSAQRCPLAVTATPSPLSPAVSLRRSTACRRNCGRSAASG